MVAKTIELPNVRSIFVPDPGYTIFDADLDRADLQVVVWEAEDDELKAMLREGADLHIENAKVLFNKPHIAKDSVERQLAKTFVHGTNYGGGARTMAINSATTVAQAELMQRRWFAAHPGIKRWHERTAAQLRSEHLVRNRFGNTRRYFDRIDGILSEALAWVPQSTVACVINRVLLAIHRTVPQAQLLHQVHDSLVGQFPTTSKEIVLPMIKTCFDVVVPYPDPLVIPHSIKLSEVSWGDCE